MGTILHCYSVDVLVLPSFRNMKGTSLPFSSLLEGEAWIVDIVYHYRQAHSKISRDRTCTARLTARLVLADLAGMGATACFQPKPRDEVPRYMT
jgi:hypothetical protein